MGGLQIKFNPRRSVCLSAPPSLWRFRIRSASRTLRCTAATTFAAGVRHIPPDQNLLYVRGFDPVTKQYRYDVNQRFGSTRPQQSTAHVLPFLSLTVQLDIGATRERQLLSQRLDLGRGHAGSKQPAESMKLLGIASIPNPMAMILQSADSLFFTRSQADSLATLSHAFAVVRGLDLDAGRGVARRSARGVQPGRRLRSVRLGARANGGLSDLARPGREGV